MPRARNRRSNSSGENLKHWDLQSGKLKRECKAESLQKFDSGFVAHIGGFRGLEFTPDGKFLLGSGITNVTNAFAGVGNPSVVAFDWSTVKQTIEHLSKGKIQGVAWGVAAHSSGVRIAATGGSGGFLLFFKPEEKNEFHNMKLKDVGRDLDSHRSSPDRRQVESYDSSAVGRIGGALPCVQARGFPVVVSNSDRLSRLAALPVRRRYRRPRPSVR